MPRCTTRNDGRERRPAPRTLLAIRHVLVLMFPEARIARVVLPRASARWAGFLIALPNARVTLVVSRILIATTPSREIAAALTRAGLERARLATGELTIFVRAPGQGSLRLWVAGVLTRRRRTRREPPKR